MKVKKACMAALIVSLLLAGCGHSGTSGQSASSRIDRGTPYITHEESEMDRYLNWFPDIEGQK